MTIREILTDLNSVAVIGISSNHARPSNRIARYLKSNGFKVFGVNPNLAGKKVDEVDCFNSIFELPEHVEIINVFRRSEFVEELMNDVLKLEYTPKVFWTQIGIISSEARTLASENNITYVENKCIMTEHINL